MRFDWPLALLALVIVPLALAAYLLIERRRARYAVRFTNLEVLAAVAGTSRPWRRWVPPALFLLALATAVTALARPQTSVSVQKENATIVLTLDTSGSMLAEDVPPTRLAAAQEAIRRFLEEVPDKFRLGFVTFSGDAQVATPLTHNHQFIRDALTYVYPGAGTAIGDAIARSVEVARGGPVPGSPEANPQGSGDGSEERPLRAILFLSDGFQTRGLLQPLEAAERAKSLGIPVYTVALGTPDGTVTFNRGGYERTIPVPPDKDTLRQVARVTGGRFFEARDANTLKAVYESLGSKLGRANEWRETSYAFVGGAAVLLLLAGLLSARWLNRLP